MPYNCLDKVLKEAGIDFKRKFDENYDKHTIIHSGFEKIFEYCNEKNVEELKKFNNGKCETLLLFIKAMTELHYVYLATICEYISQMTDDYAIKEIS